MREAPSELAGISWAEWLGRFPQLADLVAERPTYWANIRTMPAASAITSSGFTAQDVEDASLRLQRFAPLIAALFPETKDSGGQIESPLRKISDFKEQLHLRYKLPSTRSLLIKMDNQLPIAGSVKARGGVYEVLKLAETLAMQAQQLKWSENYTKLLEPEVQKLFAQHTVITGSSGNLGLAVGIMGCALGFKVRVHMSVESKEWKKALLRSKGVEIVEHDGNYALAVHSAREEAKSTPNYYFVDDENSRNLFIGYATAAEHLKKQLDKLGVPVNKEHPLHIYLPCGVGGTPSGICFGLKLIMQDHVRCCFVEPVNAPAFTFGMGTHFYGKAEVQQLGLSGSSEADCLAVSRPSAVASWAMQELVDACATIDDAELFRLLALMYDYEGVKLEPSAVAGTAGYLATMRLGELSSLTNGTHIIWATGGGLMPDEEWQRYYTEGKRQPA